MMEKTERNDVHHKCFIKLSELWRIHQIQREVSGLRTTPSSPAPGFSPLSLSLYTQSHSGRLYMSGDRISCYHHLAFHLPLLLAPLPSQPGPLLALLLPFHSKKPWLSSWNSSIPNVFSCYSNTWLDVFSADCRACVARYLAGWLLVATWPVGSFKVPKWWIPQWTRSRQMAWPPHTPPCEREGRRGH